MATDVFDLSAITDALIGLLKKAIQDSPIWNDIPAFHIEVNSGSPETSRDGAGADCQLSLYLMHIGRDPSFCNTGAASGRALPNNQQPLPLVLSYLLTAYAERDALREQQAMGIALRCFTDRAIYQPSAAEKAQFKLSDDEFTITMATESLDEMSRLWQSLTVPYRLSAVFRVAVMLLSPLQKPPAPAAPPDHLGLAVAPSDDLGLEPQLFGPALRADLTRPVPPDPAKAGQTIVPDVVTAGQRLALAGKGLKLPMAAEVFLTKLDGSTTWTVTDWSKPPVPPRGDGWLLLDLPAAYGTAPAKTPPPGVYLLSVGATAPPSRTAPTTIAIGARIDGAAAPWLLQPDVNGLFKVAGAGFTTGATQVFLGTAALAPAGAAAPGKFSVSAAEDEIHFKLPAAIDPGLYHLRVRVDGVESPPSWRVQVT